MFSLSFSAVLPHDVLHCIFAMYPLTHPDFFQEEMSHIIHVSLEKNRVVW